MNNVTGIGIRSVVFVKARVKNIIATFLYAVYINGF